MESERSKEKTKMWRKITIGNSTLTKRKRTHEKNDKTLNKTRASRGQERDGGKPAQEGRQPWKIQKRWTKQTGKDFG